MALQFEHGFPNDIFISVALGDPAANPDLADWSSRFADALTRRAAFLSRKTLRIKYASGADSGGAVEKTLTSSALLVVVVSPSYIESDLCRRHRAAFLAAPAPAGSLPASSRMLRLDTEPLTRDVALPAELVELTRHKLYRNEQGDRSSVFTFQSGDDTAEGAVVDDFARYVLERLEKLEALAAAAFAHANPVPVVVSVRDQVHLALATGDIDIQCGELRRWLDQSNYEIVSGPVRARDAAGFRTEVSSALAGARLAVFPVGRLYGWRPAEGGGRSFMALQLEEAINYPALDRIVWIPKGLDRIEEEQQRLIDDIRKTYPGHGFEVLEVPFQQLAVHLKTRGKKPAAPAPVVAPSETATDLRVYFMADLCDHEAATPYRQYLIRKGIEVDWLSKNAADSGSFHRDWLVEDHGFVIYYANSDELWYRRQQQELRKAKGYGRKTEVKSLTFLDPPESDVKNDLRLMPARLLDGLPPKELADKLKELDAFVEALKRSGGAGAAMS